jgi:peptidyl-prolyl cis-trans isomerase A (cyclophilin A)
MVLARILAPFLACTLMALGGPAAAQAGPKVKFVTSEGDFVVELYPDKAPKTVEIFCSTSKTSTTTARFFTA